MKIAIDARYVGRSGLGRVCEGILDHFDYARHDVTLIGDEDKLKKYTAARIVGDKTDPYSVKGLFSYPKKLNGECDALIVPNFLIPFGVKIPVYSVMHDLMFLDEDCLTRGMADKAVKRYLLRRCMKKSAKIACVSQFTLSRCAVHFPKWVGKCFVDYQGLSQNILSCPPQKAEKRNTVVFVGNVKPHKGVQTLLEAFAMTEGLTLKIIGKRDHFVTGLSLDETAYRNVQFTGVISDDELFDEIASAKYLVQPSRYEGFGIPPLEALWLGTQPIVSDIEVFREVYGKLPVVFFRQGDAASLAQKLAAPAEDVDCRGFIEKTYNYDSFVKGLMEGIGCAN